MKQEQLITIKVRLSTIESNKANLLLCEAKDYLETKEEYKKEQFFNEWCKEQNIPPYVKTEHRKELMNTLGFEMDYARFKLREACDDFVNSFRFKWIGRMILKHTKIQL